MIGPLELLSAFLLDTAIGDPRWLPHPVRLIGRAISDSETFLRRHFKTPSQEKTAGFLLIAIIVVPSFFAALMIDMAISSLPDGVIKTIGKIILICLVATTIATRELIRSARAVIISVKDGSLIMARRNLSMIVGRDTTDLSERQILTAVTETLAENLSDGVIAPIFYLMLGGLPLAMAYKSINTLDSMVGYKNDRYINFGWASARLDDLANYIPARITGLLIVLAVFLTTLCRRGSNALLSAGRTLEIMLRDGRNHTSPNSGIPEAAMAGALGIRMGGPSTYAGVLVVKPYIGESVRDVCASGSESAMTIAWMTSIMGVGIAAAVLFLRSGL